MGGTLAAFGVSYVWRKARMKLIDEQEFTIKLHKEATGDTLRESHVIIKGDLQAPCLKGAILEACFSVADKYLVVLSDGCAFEDGLNIYLLSVNLEVLDTATMGWPYATGIFKLISYDNNIMLFEFFDGVWSIEVFHKSKFVLPLISEPQGVWRSFGFKRHFKISKI